MSVTAAAGAPQSAERAAAVKHMPTLEDAVLAEINALRRGYGLAQLRLNARLAATARDHSHSMAERGFFQHSALPGSPAQVAAKYGGGTWQVGENLVWSSPRLSAKQALAMWLKSPPHRRNLLAPRWREIGLGAVHADSAPGVYAGLAATILTAEFGARR
jgi:uncharacterized protein YkwD